MSSLYRLLSILALVLLAGCSRTELLYDNADWLAERWASDLMDASDAQQDSWREMFRLAMDEHRRELLPAVINLLRAMEASSAKGLSADELTCWIEAADRAYRAHAEWAVPRAAAVLLDISPQQADHLAAELEKRNQAYREDYLDEDPARRERDRIERYIERTERWTGELSTGQLRLVEKAVGDMPDVAGDWLEYRAQQQQRLLALLRQGADEQTLRRFLVDWWVDFDDLPVGLEHKIEQVRHASVGLVLALDETLTDEQRAGFLEKVRDMREDLEAVPGNVERRQLAWQDLSPCTSGGSQLN
ncbi:MAG: DUF6279 family lipoprotein [Chromatiaceae bacterium]|nr:DUF6279 family lipoprotein [Chromatiaceae bacterium]